MILLHGSWCPQANSRYGGAFFLWAEAETAPGESSSARLRADAIHPHPAAVSARQVRAAWRALSPNVPLPAAVSRGVVWLPSSSGRPVPAPELPGAERPGPKAVLAAWEVQGIALSAHMALQQLAVLPEQAPGPWPEVALGADLHFWSLAGKLALELLARQCYAPGLTGGAGEPFRAVWAVQLADPVDRERFGRLSAGMPPACRALQILPAAGRSSTVRVTPGNLPPPGQLLDSFIASAVDSTVRHWGRGQAAPPEARPSPLALLWRQALERRTTPDGQPPPLTGTMRPLQALAEQLRQWLEPLTVGAAGAFRVAFRLEPPADGDAWTLHYLLQATDDPSLLVPADQVWREARSALHYLNRRFESPQEQLLAGLGRAARISAPIERSLQQARPSTCALTTPEAYSFLREAAPLLENAGFGVLVPPWWSKRSARLGARLQVSPAAQGAAAGILGLNTLVQYDWEISLGDETLTREEFLKLASLKVPLVQVRGQWVELRPDQVERMLQFWQEQRQGSRAAGVLGRREGTLAEALRLAQSLGEGDSTPLPITGVEASGWVEDLLAQWTGREPLQALPPPATFHGQLRPYQVNGLSWLAFLERWGLGACLADDMGLGKTIQVLALLLYRRETGRAAGPSLLICPTSAVGNWQREAARFAPDLRVLVHYGGARSSGEELRAEAAQHDLVLSTYNLLYRDATDLAGIEWDGVLLDEAQNIKNPDTRQAQAARGLAARFRVALTGTPVENRLGELWSIFEFLNPGYLGSQNDFRRRFALPIERYQDPEALQRLKSLVRPFLLRRVKTDPLVIADLPEKLEMDVFCPLTAEQATLYQAVVDDMLQQVEASEGIKRKGIVLALLLKLKQICNHPAQFLGDGSSLPGRSGKLERLTDMLAEAIDAGDRALVFTQFAEMGTMLQQHLRQALGCEVLFLHGGVSRVQREKMIRRFQEEANGPPVFVLSLKAGGTALNLMRASHVFHFDRWWNPAVESQATDRAFRIGQTKNVQVHKFICLGTLEERIAELMERKRALAENVVDAGEGWLTELSTAELAELLKLRRDS